MTRYITFSERRKCARLKIAFCGSNRDYLDVTAFIPPTNVPVRNRSTKREKTSDEQREYNERASERKFQLYVKHNCADGFFVTLTFCRKYCPADYDGVTNMMKVFFRRLRNWCCSLGITLRWLYVIEIGAKGGRYHVHAMINKEVPQDRIRHLWDENGYGRSYVRPIASSTEELDAVAGYMAKSPEGRHSYHKSDTMVLPAVETDDGLLDKDTLMSIAFDADYNARVVSSIFEQLFTGYRYVTHEGYYSEHLMSPYVHVEMERIRDTKARIEQYVLLSERQLPYTQSFLRRLEPDQAELLVHGVA